MPMRIDSPDQDSPNDTDMPPMDMPDAPQSETQLVNTQVNPPNVKAPSFPPDWSYEATVAQVEAVVGQLETGKLPLADVFDRFTTAVEQLEQCKAFLEQKQQQVDLLIEALEDE